MIVGEFWTITDDTLEGPWHVASKNFYWYIVNVKTSEAVRIGRMRKNGKNYFDISKAEAQRRNDIAKENHLLGGMR